MKVATTRRRGTLLLVAMMVALLTISGVALAANFVGTNGPDRINGTNGRDKIRGLGGNDTIYGFKGRDYLWGERGRDKLVDGPLREQATDYLYGGPGNDGINVRNSPAHRDYVNCGPGRDRVRFDRYDVLRRC